MLYVSYRLNLYVIAAVVHVSTLKLDFCSQKGKQEKAMPFGTSESHWQCALCVHKRKFVLPLIRQQNYDGTWGRRRINLDDELSVSGSGHFILVPTSQQT